MSIKCIYFSLCMYNKRLLPFRPLVFFFILHKFEKDIFKKQDHYLIFILFTHKNFRQNIIRKEKKISFSFNLINLKKKDN